MKKNARENSLLCRTRSARQPGAKRGGRLTANLRLCGPSPLFFARRWLSRKKKKKPDRRIAPHALYTPVCQR